MDNNKMVHLHAHTEGSLRDGLGRTQRMVSHAKMMGFKALAITDHGTLSNSVQFALECKAAGIKPIQGLEGYVYFDGVIGHITLLADGPMGWHSLLQLNNHAHASEYKQPAFTIDQLMEYNAGLVCLTGCVSSPFQQLPPLEAYRLGVQLKTAFGSRLFAELMFVGDSLSWERPLALAAQLRLKKVITNDVHFPHSYDAAVHPILTQMKSGFEYDSSQLYLKSANELIDAAKSFGIDEEEAEEMLARTAFIGKKIKYVNLKHEPSLPSVSTLVNLERLVRVRSEDRMFFDTEKYQERLKYELDIIKTMGYEDYFVILDDLISEAKLAGVKVGPGRGSAVGSLVLYALGITQIDPLRFDLSFERFLNPMRKGMPDVDVDLESERRDYILDYAAKTYGSRPIMTYSRYSHKSLVRDLGRYFKIEKKMVDEVADKGPDSKEFAALLEEAPGEFEEAYDAFIGQMRHKGKHAGGIIVTDTPVPVERIHKGELAAAWSEGRFNELSYAGVVKFDLLGLSVLSAIRSLEEKYGFEAPPPTPDAYPFNLFREGNLSGIFQFAGSDGIRELTMKLEPRRFEDLIAINALYRPGAIDSGAASKYAEWRSTPRKIAPWVDDILRETYGAIVYQEQVMALFAEAVGGTMAEADLARRVITKSKPDDPVWEEQFEALSHRFIDGCFDHGMTWKEAEDLWEELATHSRYSFNKAHSTAYSMIAWQCAWWKYFHAAAFYAAMLNIDPAEEQTYVFDAVSQGIRVLPPHVNESTERWEERDGAIYMPLSAVKFMGEKGAVAVVKERETHGQFIDPYDFLSRVPKRFVRKNAREGLLFTGGFYGLIKGGWKEAAEALELDVEEYELGRSARQAKYLGFILPDAKMLGSFKRYEEGGYDCGIVKSIEWRESKSGYGPYAVYKMSPRGVFWGRDLDIEVGNIIAVKVNSSNGKVKEIVLI